MTTTAEKHIQAMKRAFQSEKAKGLEVTYKLQVTGTGGGIWLIKIANSQCEITEDALADADVSILVSGANFLRMASGDLDLRAAYQQKQVQIEGDPQLALSFAYLFPPWVRSIPSSPKPSTAPAQPTTPTPPRRSPAAQPAAPVQPQPQPAAPKTPAKPQPTVPSRTPAAAPSPVAAKPTLADYVTAMPKGLRANRAPGLRAAYQFQLSGSGGGTWTVSVANGRATVASGAGAANVTIAMSGSDFIELARGRLNTTQAYQQGRLRIDGDLNLAAMITDIFAPWAGLVEKQDTPAPAPAPAVPQQPARTPERTPTPDPSPEGGSVYAKLMNGSFDEYQPFVYKNEAKVWKEPQFPEEYGKYWNLEIHEVGKGRLHAMQSGVFGKFTQKYFGGGGRDYHIHGHHSQVFTSRYNFKISLAQTISVQPGRDYTFSGSLVSFYKGTAGERADGKIFKSIGIDPTGGREYYGDNVVWSARDGKDNEWRYPSLKVKAQGDAVSVFILLENTERDVGRTELNIIHLDHFKFE